MCLVSGAKISCDKYELESMQWLNSWVLRQDRIAVCKSHERIWNLENIALRPCMFVNVVLTLCTRHQQTNTANKQPNKQLVKWGQDCLNAIAQSSRGLLSYRFEAWLQKSVTVEPVTMVWIDDGTSNIDWNNANDKLYKWQLVLPRHLWLFCEPESWT